MRLTITQARIKLDIDARKPDLDTIRRRIDRAGYFILQASVQQSPSGKGWHVEMDVTPRPKHPMEVVALQAICGSDPYREAMQMHRARGFSHAPVWMREMWNVLYQPHPKRQRHMKLEE
jgi:acetolactate synthase regulatory subunit